MKPRIFNKIAAWIVYGASLAPILTPASLAFAQSGLDEANNGPIFQTRDARTRTPRFVRTGAAIASREKIAIIVWGGNREMQQQAYYAALDLRDQGIPLAFIVGPDLNGYDVDANFQVYARVAPVFEGNGALLGANHIAEVRPTVTRMARTALRDLFPEQAATLGLGEEP